MGNLSNREIFLIILLLNFLLYYVAFQFIAVPLLDYKKTCELNYENARAENQKIIYEMSMRDNYKMQIEDYKKERLELYTKVYPKAETETLHKFMARVENNNNISIQKIQIISSQDSTVNEDGVEIQSILKNNIINMSINANYTNVIDFMEEIENINKTSAVTALSMNGLKENLNVNIVYNICTVNEDTQDTIFEFNEPIPSNGIELKMP